MKKIFVLIILFFHTEAFASFKNEIIRNLKSIDNVTFNFEQNINGKIENGKCTIKYPKKIYCKYNSRNKKILVSNGKILVIKTINGSRTIEDMRYKIESCADGVIDYMSEQMIMPRVYEDFGHDLDVHDAERLANIVYQQIKYRM